MDDFSVREAVESDAEPFLNLLLELERETTFLLFEPGERPANLELQRQRFATIHERRERVFVAERNGLLIGYIGVRAFEPRRVRHTATLAMGVRREVWRRGVGSALLAAAEHWARGAGIRRMELTVMDSNIAAHALYRSARFVPEGIRRYALCVDGRMQDEVFMAKYLDADAGPAT